MKFPTKFWKKKDKKEKEAKKAAKDKKSKKSDDLDIKVEVKKDETVNGEILTPEVAENGAVTPGTESPDSVSSTEGTTTDSSTAIQPTDDTTKAELESGVETDKKTEGKDKVQVKEKKKKGGILSSSKVKKVEKKRPPHIEDPNSGVFIFGNKVEGKFKKVMLSLLAISLIPPTFLFGIALLMCVFLLLYPLMAFLVLAIFPTVVCSMFVLLALVPVLLPLVIIFLLITGKGKLSLYDEGKLVVLKFAKWAMPTI